VGNWRPRRILMTADTVGGVWTFALELAAQIAARGTEVWLVAFGGLASEAQQRQCASIANLRLFSSPLKLEWMDDPWDDVSESCGFLWELARDCKPELVHLNSFGHSGLPWQVPVVLTAHSCVTSWWSAVDRTSLPPGWETYHLLVQRALTKADLVTAPSKWMLNELEKHYSISLRSSRTISNGRRPFGFGAVEKEPFLISAGRLWDRAKNIRALTEVADGLAWPVFLAGEQQSPNGATAFLANCHLLGNLAPEVLATWFARAAIYVTPARYEPFGLAVLEAALSGCALVLSDIPTFREIWRDAAVFVSLDDKNQLRSVLQNLTENPGRREEIAQRCWRRAQLFTAERMANAYENAYRSTASSRAPCAS
jgi:glycogen(starch) synthase